MDAASEHLKSIIGAAASRRREEAIPTGHIRERIAVALRSSEPSFFDWSGLEEIRRKLYFRDSRSRRERFEQWADRLLVEFDALDIEITDKRRVE